MRDVSRLTETLVCQYMISGVSSSVSAFHASAAPAAVQNIFTYTAMLAPRCWLGKLGVVPACNAAVIGSLNHSAGFAAKARAKRRHQVGCQSCKLSCGLIVTSRSREAATGCIVKLVLVTYWLRPSKQLCAGGADSFHSGSFSFS